MPSGWPGAEAWPGPQCSGGSAAQAFCCGPWRPCRRRRALSPRGAPAPGRGHDRPIHALRSVLGREGAARRGLQALLVLLPFSAPRRPPWYMFSMKRVYSGDHPTRGTVCLPWGVGVAAKAGLRVQPGGLASAPTGAPGAAPNCSWAPAFPAPWLLARWAGARGPLAQLAGGAASGSSLGVHEGSACFQSLHQGLGTRGFPSCLC